MITPYWSDDTCALYLGDCREVLPALGVTADLVVADPPYGETSLAWDRWPDGWLDVAATVTSSLWCFGSIRMFLDRHDDFAGWRLSHDVIWEKPGSAGRAARDRFARSHEQATHWYRGPWGGQYHEPPRQSRSGPGKGSVHRGATGPQWNGARRANTWTDDGTRIMRSVIRVANMRLRGIHPTEKPVGILTPLIEYACPPGGLVIDPFAGSGSTLEAARLTGRRAIGIEANEEYAEKAKLRLSQAPLEIA